MSIDADAIRQQDFRVRAVAVHEPQHLHLVEDRHRGTVRLIRRKPEQRLDAQIRWDSGHSRSLQRTRCRHCSQLEVSDVYIAGDAHSGFVCISCAYCSDILYLGYFHCCMFCVCQSLNKEATCFFLFNMKFVHKLNI